MVIKNLHFQMTQSTHSIDFANWLNDSYEPCGNRQWKRRYPKTSEEMKKCYSTDELYVLFSKN
jgi:hypothetical protein